MADAKPKLMGIDHDIHQRRFRNEHQKAGINLIYTFNWVNDRLRQLFDQHDITPQQFNILRILRGAGEPISTLQIRQRMLDKMSDTSRIVDRLLKKNLVKKVTCRADRRLVDVSITDKGLRLLEQMDLQEDEIDGILRNLTEAEAQTLNSLLDKIRNAGSQF